MWKQRNERWIEHSNELRTNTNAIHSSVVGLLVGSNCFSDVRVFSRINIPPQYYLGKYCFIFASALPYTCFYLSISAEIWCFLHTQSIQTSTFGNSMHRKTTTARLRRRVLFCNRILWQAISYSWKNSQMMHFTLNRKFLAVEIICGKLASLSFKLHLECVCFFTGSLLPIHPNE